MRWVPDRTGRFRQRPHYEAREIDQELGDLVLAFLRERYGTVRFPIRTDDLTVLVERYAVLDPYADLSKEGVDVEGVTYFNTPMRPLVRIASELSTDARRHKRYRTTLTHELTHVRLHSFLWSVEAPSLDLLPNAATNDGPRCRRETIISAASTDWMEWQAGYGCGAILMPATEVRALLRSIDPDAPPPDVGPAADRAIRAVVDAFEVSEDAARVRLFKLNEFSPVNASPLAR